MTTTPIGELRAATARLRAELPSYAVGTAYVVQGDSESMDTIAWCNADHSDDPAPACCVDAIETGHPALAQLIVALLNAREPLAAWLEGVVAAYPTLLAAIANGTYDEPLRGELGYALAAARAATAATPVYAPVWDGSCAPGGMVCNLCGTPVESEPCHKHATAEELRAVGALTEGAAL